MKTTQQSLYTIREVADLFNIHYLQVYKAIVAGITQPLQSKRSRLLTDQNIKELKNYFEAKKEKKIARS